MKRTSAPTFKKAFGFHPVGVWCDSKQEFLVGLLRPGQAGSNTAADHIAVLADAISQVPGRAPPEAAGPLRRRGRLP